MSQNTSPASNAAIWRMTWPQMLMMLCQFLVGFTDVWVAGRLGGSVQSAFGFVSQCLFFLMVIGMALGAAGVTTVSQSLGAGKKLRAQRYSGLVLSLSMGLCFIIMALGYVFQEQIFLLLRVPHDIRTMFVRFWNIYLLCLPANYFFSVSAALFRARKLVKVPLITGALVCAVNVIGDFGLGMGYFGLPDMGGDGIAWATCISLLAGALANIWFMRRYGFLDRYLLPVRRWVRMAVPYLVKVTLPTGAMQTLWQLGALMFYVLLGTLPDVGSRAVGGLAVGMRVESILFLPAFAFNMTASILVGHFLGAGQKDEAKRVALRIIIVGCLGMAVFSALLWPWMRLIAEWMSPVAVVEAGTVGWSVADFTVAYLRVNLIAIPFTIGSMILSGIMIGAGSTIYSLIVNGGSIWLLRLPLAWFLGHYAGYGAPGAFAAMLVSQVVQSSTLFWIFMTRDWSRFSLRAQNLARTARRAATLSPSAGTIPAGTASKERV